ncbi:MAG: NUDIX domain-containing protein, partial [Candidatus Lokiarchaeota archaeon]|nr:NUDIX domain-containing protein [Candidatus Lokiarchaeota archaeon]
MEKLNLTYDEKLIKKKLLPCNSTARVSLKDAFFTSSAILFSILPFDDKPYELVLIHRTNRGSRHRGEISFPGGKFELGDGDLKNTALRETEEEIGVPRLKIEVLGCLHDFPTMTKYIIKPFVGRIPPNQKLIKEEREVQEILRVPIDFFVGKRNFKEQAFKINKGKFPVFYFNYKNPANKKIYTI